MATGNVFDLVQSVEQNVPKPSEPSAPELAVNARPFAEMLGLIAPLCAGSRQPENTI
jgi:hypothetical protein